MGRANPIPLAYIRQIPAVHGVVSSYSTFRSVSRGRSIDRGLRAEVERNAMFLSVIESIPFHRDIKLRSPHRRR